MLEVKAQDEFGISKVKEANEYYVLLYNKDNTINLAQNSVQPLYGELKFKVADSSTALRFYPMFEHTIPAPQGEVKASAQATSQQPASLSTVTANSAAVSQPVSPESNETVHTTKAEKPSTSTASPTRWNWVIFTAAGLIGTGYLC